MAERPDTNDASADTGKTLDVNASVLNKNCTTMTTERSPGSNDTVHSPDHQNQTSEESGFGELVAQDLPSSAADSETVSEPSLLVSNGVSSHPGNAANVPTNTVSTENTVQSGVGTSTNGTNNTDTSQNGAQNAAHQTPRTNAAPVGNRANTRNIPPQAGNQLINVRDRLFHALFYRVALTYARAVPKPLRRFIEFGIFLKVCFELVCAQFRILITLLFFSTSKCTQKKKKMK